MSFCTNNKFYQVTQKSDLTRSVIEVQLRGRLRCFKRSPVAQRLRYIMSIFRNFFKNVKSPELRISRKMASLKSWKSRQKQGIDLQPFQIFKTMRSVFYFRLEIGKSFENFQSKFIVPRCLSICYQFAIPILFPLLLSIKELPVVLIILIYFSR